MEKQQPQFTIEELGAEFGAALAQAYGKLITSGKTIKILQAQIQDMTDTEARLIENAEDFEAELAALKSENFELKQTVETQRAQLEDRAEAMKSSMLSPEMAKIAEADSAIIKEKAAPVEAA
jgi:SMC interacting uncharacterized protein involved in chromosome segregation